MDYKSIKGIELNLAQDAVYEFKFGIQVGVIAAVKKGKARFEINIIPQIPKPIGRPRKERSETSYRFVKASDLHQGKFYELDDVAGFLRDFLQNGPRFSGEIFEATSGFGWNRRSVYDAAKMLDLDKRPRGEGRNLRWMWSLNEQTNMAHDTSGDASYMEAEREERDFSPPRDNFGNR